MKLTFLFVLGISATHSPGTEPDKPAAAIQYETPAMPAHPPADWLTYHLFHPGTGKSIPGDPNCIFFWKGLYHLHYINDSQGFSFAHVSSTDMVHWKWHPTTLIPKTTGHGMFSGTGFITRDGQPAIIYHGMGSGKNWIAYPLDDNFEQWSKPEAVVVLADDGIPVKMKFWDPDCWINGDSYYALSGGKNPSLMKSPDLKAWKSLGPLLHDAFPENLGVPRDEDISCANFFQIGNKWMLLCISHRLGCRYYLGSFKDEKFLPDYHALMSWNGRNFFAPESVLTPDGRRVMWAWIFELPIAPTGVQALPRELELPADGILRIRPLRELATLRYDSREETTITVPADATHPLNGIGGHAIELEVTVKAPKATEFGLNVLGDKEGKHGLRIAVVDDGKTRTLQVGKVIAPLALNAGEDLTLRVFIDKNFVEVFANDRQAAATAIPFVAENTGIQLFSTAADIEVKTVRSWKMKSIYGNYSVQPD